MATSTNLVEEKNATMFVSTMTLTEDKDITISRGHLQGEPNFPTAIRFERRGAWGTLTKRSTKASKPLQSRKKICANFNN
jgi:hypothetical protein